MSNVRNKTKIAAVSLAVLTFLSFSAAQENVLSDSNPSNPISGISLDGLDDWFMENIGKFAEPEYSAAFLAMWIITYGSMAVLVNVVASRDSAPWDFDTVVEFLLADDSDSPPARGSITYNNIVLVISALTLFTLLGGPLDNLLGNFYLFALLLLSFLVISILIGVVTIGSGTVFGVLGYGSKGTAWGYMKFRNSPAGRAMDSAFESIPYIDDINNRWNGFLQNQGWKLCNQCGKLHDEANLPTNSSGNPECDNCGNGL